MKSIGIFFDADNMSVDLWDQVVAFAQKSGKIAYIKVFRANTVSQKEREKIMKITPNYIEVNAGKNAVDFAIIFEMGRAAGSKEVDAIMLVSSDLDFTTATRYVVSHGIDMLIFSRPGPKWEVDCFTKLCYAQIADDQPQQTNAALPFQKIVRAIPDEDVENFEIQRFKRQALEYRVSFISKLIKVCFGNGYHDFVSVINRLQKLQIDPLAFGFRKWANFFRAYKHIFRVKKQNNRQVVTSLI